jgi:hypothetical protein
VKDYRLTWRHEVTFKAEDDEDAKQVWESLLLGELDNQEEVHIANDLSHEFVETVSFECVSDDYREVMH